jgi:glycine betaine/proline transport system substrate-binding protein
MKLKLTALILSSALLVAPLVGCAAQAEESTPQGSKSITIAEAPGYDDDIAVNALWTKLLKDKGYAVKSVNIDLAAGFAGISQGDIDAYMDAWLPTTHGVYVDKFKDKLTIVNLAENKPYQANNRLVLAVPDYMPEKTISDLAKSPTSYGSQIVGIEAGSGEMRLLPDLMKTYGLSENVKLISGSTPAMLAALSKAIAAKEPIVAALWTPHWAFAKMPIRVLEDDKKAWPPADGSYIVLNKKYASENPEVVKWFSRMKLNDEQMAKLMLDVSEGKTKAAGVDKWLEDKANKELAESWTK